VAGFPFPGLLNLKIRPRVFVSYHHELDQWYYEQLSTILHDTYEVVTDRSLDEEIDSGDADYVMRRIREEFITGTSCTMVLCGAETAQRKFVDWEIKATLDKEHALVGVALPSAPPANPGRFFKPWRLDDNVVSTYALVADWNSIVASPGSVAPLIATASARLKTLIVNSRPMMAYNG
jgi:hypothetical protein